MRSLLSLERWYRNSGCVGISFDEIVNEKGEHIPLEAMPAQVARIIKNKAEGKCWGSIIEGKLLGPGRSNCVTKPFVLDLTLRWRQQVFLVLVPCR